MEASIRTPQISFTECHEWEKEVLDLVGTNLHLQRERLKDRSVDAGLLTQTSEVLLLQVLDSEMARAMIQMAAILMHGRTTR